MELIKEFLADVPEAPESVGPRMRFQWNCLKRAEGPVLNVGSCDDPLKFGDRVIHMDYDDWSAYFREIGAPFIQGDAHRLTEYFGYGLFDLVILGDVLEHALNPDTVIRNCCRVSRRAVCFTVWEEWRHPGPGQWLEDTLREMDEEAQGATDGEITTYYDYYESVHPEVNVCRDQSHLGHINQFTDNDATKWCIAIIEEGYSLVAAVRMAECEHEGHLCQNWLIYAERSV